MLATPHSVGFSLATGSPLSTHFCKTLFHVCTIIYICTLMSVIKNEFTLTIFCSFHISKGRKWPHSNMVQSCYPPHVCSIRSETSSIVGDCGVITKSWILEINSLVELFPIRWLVDLDNILCYDTIPPTPWWRLPL